MIWIALIVAVLFIAVMGYTRSRRRGEGEAGDDPGSLHHNHHDHGASGSSGHHGGGGGFSGGGHH